MNYVTAGVGLIVVGLVAYLALRPRQAGEIREYQYKDEEKSRAAMEAAKAPATFQNPFR